MAALLVQTATPATRLLFVTSRTAMDQAGLTQRELHAATTSGGHKVILLPNNLGDKVSVRAQTAARLVRERTPNWQQFDGVVLIGGYDSVPPQRLDCLDPELRKAAAEAAAGDGEFIDSDGYLVWNDDHYADFTSTRIPERPVSRIPCWPKHGRGFPDCGTVVRGQLHGLKTKPPSSPRALGMRSNEFPFAKHVFDKFFGGRDVQLQSFPQAAPYRWTSTVSAPATSTSCCTASATPEPSSPTKGADASSTSGAGPTPLRRSG
jgi:hypothetical protein